MVWAAVEMASGVPAVCVRRDGVVAAAVLSGVAVMLVATVVLGVAVAPAVLVFAGSVWVVFAGVAVLLLAAVFAAGVFALALSSASPASLAVSSACACCPAVA